MLAAAKVLRVNQSTVQLRLSELERRLGRQLLTRQGHSYKLTLHGDELRQAAQHVEAAVAAFECDLAAGDHGLTGTIRVTTSGIVAERLRKSGLIDAFQSRLDRLSVGLIVSDRCLDLSKGEADVAIRAGKPSDHTLIARKTADVPWAVYAGQPYIDCYGAPGCVEEIGQHSVVLCDDPRMDCPSTSRLRAVAPNARIVARCESGRDPMRLVQTGVGLAVLLAYERDDDLIRVIDNASRVTQYYVLMHEDMQKAAKVRALADFVASQIGALRASVFR